MIQMITILLCLISIIAGFFSILWGWIVFGVPTVILLVTLFSLKQKRWAYIVELSSSANEMLQKFGHFYAMPFAARDFSASGSTLMFAGIVVAIVNAFKGFWWGIGIAILNWFVMGFVSRAFNPANFLVDYDEQSAHEEIIEYIQRKQSEERNSQT